MERTLYINGNINDIKIIVDGPSLLIRRQNMADSRIPFNMISSVIIFGNITLHTDVLTMLAHNNIPVLFISKWAEYMNISMPIQYIISIPNIHFEKIIKDTQKVDDFRNWSRAKRAYLQTTIIKRVHHWHSIYFESTWNWNYKNISKVYREIISFLMPDDKEKWWTVKNIIKILFWNGIIEKLKDTRFDIHSGIVHCRTAFGLVKDYLYILAPEMDYQALQFFKSESVYKLIEEQQNACLLTATGIQNIINRFENEKFIFKKITKDITDKLIELIEK